MGCKILRAAQRKRQALLAQALAHVGGVERLAGLVVEPVDDGPRRAGRGQQAEPRAALQLPHADFGHGRHVGHCGKPLRRRHCERAHPPLRQLLAVSGTMSNIMVTWPATTSCSAGAAPRYGTCTMSMSCICRNCSPTMCPELPLPGDA